MKQIYAMKKIAVALMLAVAMPAAVQAQSETNVLFYESFNSLDGQGGNDGYFDNNTEAGVEVGAEDLLSSEKLDNPEGWGEFVKVAICDKCVRIATKKNNGEITTPAFAVNGNATLTFNAAAQEGDIETLRNNNKVYDLQGREVKAPGKGIYIVNGKKVVLTNAR